MIYSDRTACKIHRGQTSDRKENSLQETTKDIDDEPCNTYICRLTFLICMTESNEKTCMSLHYFSICGKNQFENHWYTVHDYLK